MVFLCGTRCAWQVKNCLVNRGAAVLSKGNDLKMAAIVVRSNGSLSKRWHDGLYKWGAQTVKTLPARRTN